MNSMLYKVVAPNGRTVVVFQDRQTIFHSYEAARRAVRKVLRAKARKGLINRMSIDRSNIDGTLTLKYGMWDRISRNPVRLGGYKIVRV